MHSIVVERRERPPVPGSRVLRCLASVCTAVLFVGCFGAYGTATFGRPVDQVKLKQILPGQTTVWEVFEHLGPPEYIIDGSHRIIDEAAFYAAQHADFRKNRPVPTRQLQAPEGMVILIYATQTGELGQAQIAGGLVQFAERFGGARRGELFIYILKTEGTVVTLLTGPTDRK